MTSAADIASSESIKRMELSAQSFSAARVNKGWLDGQIVYVEGRTRAGDGAQGLFHVTLRADLEDDDGSVLRSGQFALVRDGVEYLDPRWWGAKGDGVTDDTQPLQKTLEAALLNSVKAVGVYAGTYCFRTLSVPKGVSVMGKGGVLKIADNVCVDAKKKYYFLHNLSGGGNRFVDLSIDGNSENNRDFLVADALTAAHDDVVVSGCRITNAPDSGIMLANAGNGQVVGNQVSGSRDVGIYVNDLRSRGDALGSLVAQNLITNCVYAGVAIKRRSRGVLVTANVISRCGNGITVEDFGDDGGTPANISICSNLLQSIGYPHRGKPRLAEVGISLTSTDGAIVSSNRIVDVSGAGIRLSGTRACSIVGNVVSGSSNSAPPGGAFGIVVENRGRSLSTRNFVQANVVYGIKGAELLDAVKSNSNDVIGNVFSREVDIK